MTLPPRLHSVDALGLGGLVGLLMAAYFVVFAPTRALLGELIGSRAQLIATRSACAASRTRLREVEQQTREMREMLATRLSEAPVERDLNGIVTRIVDRAAAVGLHVQSVQPQPARMQRDHAVASIEIKAHGEPDALLRYLDTLAAEHPYHEVRGLTITASGAVESTCAITLLLELHMLPDKRPSPAPGDRK